MTEGWCAITNFTIVPNNLRNLYVNLIDTEYLLVYVLDKEFWFTIISLIIIQKYHVLLFHESNL